MPCDTRLKPRQTLQQRAAEVRKAVDAIDKGIAAGRVRPVVDKKTGAIAFAGITDDVRDGVTDACCLRRLLATGSALTKQAIGRAEMLAGRSIDRQVVASGYHSHDGGASWHPGHKH